ncbi:MULTISPECIES: AEC family transporter [Bombella]|uniref:AEC family transporter n=1 Tax=Bombella saccharophila TaxID=2967338 RepID=A0ABT3WB41_9PROT|nr:MULTISPECIES: AEC family transporter [Bombella]MCX5615017.1 AEC family transporter [Bombella saccharophila]MUG90637.1 permease [Bombella sp. ESL0385]
MTTALFLTIINAILPILITLGLGYVAAWRRDFDSQQASILIRLVMLYALPLALFTSILSTPRAHILSAGPLAGLILVAMLGIYVVLFCLLRWVMKRRQSEAALIAMTITGPSVPFIGIPVLGQLFGPSSAVPISVGSLVMNLCQIPLTLILMNHDQQRQQCQHEGPYSWHTTMRELGGHLLHSCKEPVVWAPMLAFLLVLLGIGLPVSLTHAFQLLGHATGGTALFASGVVLCARQVRLSLSVGLMVLGRNFLIPLGVCALAFAGHLPTLTMQEGVLAMAMPSAAINVILAMRYHIMEREIASVLFFGTVSAIFSLAFFIWMTHS